MNILIILNYFLGPNLSIFFLIPKKKKKIINIFSFNAFLTNFDMSFSHFFIVFLMN